MEFQAMERLIDHEYERIRQLRATKGLEYAGEEDTLADFKEVAEQTGTTPLQVWATYVKKHQRAIDSFIRLGRVQSEAIESRIRDVIVYHLLLLGLLEDQRQNLPAAKPLACGVIHHLGVPGSPVDEHLHRGVTIECELPMGHLEPHYGRTEEGHGFQWQSPQPAAETPYPGDNMMTRDRDPMG